MRKPSALFRKKRSNPHAPAASARVRAKMRDTAGDTFVEVLIALFIAVVGATLLATMAMTATNIATQSKAKMDSLYQQENALAQNVPYTGSATIIAPSDLVGTTVSVKVYETDEFLRYNSGS